MPRITNLDDSGPLYDALQELNLTENEQRLYATALSQGPVSVSDLAEKTGVTRPNLYKLIDGLIDKGLADARSHLRYSKRFIVKPPTAVADLLKAKRAEQSAIDRSFMEKLPSYMAGFRQGEGPSKVKILVGYKDFEKMYTQMYEEAKDEICFCGSLKEFTESFGKEFVVMNVQKRLEHGVSGLALIMPSDRDYYSAKEHQEHRREVRYLDGYAGFETSFHLFSNKIAFYQPKVPMAILVEDEYLVKMMKSLFRGLWERAARA